MSKQLPASSWQRASMPAREAAVSLL